MAFILLGLGGLHAQENSSASGGEATGDGGVSSYTVGQVVYTSNTGTNGSVEQGVQQPYDISVINVNEIAIDLELSVYPNPTKNYLVLESKDTDNLNFQLIDVIGNVIENRKVNSESLNINLEKHPAAIYFLKITKNNQLVKTFKIIKK
ncbi:T9SS type A sorting domain-containing protein [Aureivirga sp. CE67]|uniref:T9SS type A sorting domain-containing protein n=1 Tax=Aureivirga sp. CE67 TaxID=1788983 RepID=UPI0018CA9E59|nr:T9SS type A sorting domain-containing protein [Aureivirga sp. CE67]